ncbi:MAG: DUF2064 domain-containing protein [Flavobacteriaceae bacterium]
MQQKLTQNTAVLLFANSAEEDCYIKKIADSKRLFDALTERTLRTVRATGLPFFHVNEKQQLGNTFGERFSNAIQAIYDKGYKNVITIGNDSPQLKASHIIEAERQLQLGKTVLGPSSDGGFYLMGLHCSNFDPTLFLRLPWQRFGLFNKIFQLFESCNSHVFRLPVLHDIDTKEDIANILRFSKTIAVSILKILSSLLKRHIRIVSKNIQILQYHFTSLYFNKGSPVLMQFS